MSGEQMVSGPRWPLVQAAPRPPPPVSPQGGLGHAAQRMAPPVTPTCRGNQRPHSHLSLRGRRAAPPLSLLCHSFITPVTPRKMSLRVFTTLPWNCDASSRAAASKRCWTQARRSRTAICGNQVRMCVSSLSFVPSCKPAPCSPLRLESMFHPNVSSPAQPHAPGRSYPKIQGYFTTLL